MNGLIALVGSGEYLPVMMDVDRHLLESLNINGRKPRVACLPTAAGQEGDASVNRWLNMGTEHFQKLGADVAQVRIIDRASADDPQWEPILENADLIYFSGGSPGYLYEMMNGSRAWKAAQRAWDRGSVYAGCSGGAMVLADRIPRLRLPGTVKGFGVVPAKIVLPHFDAAHAFFRIMANTLRLQLKKGERMIGVDEDTALVGKLGGGWQVMGKSKVHVFTRESSNEYASGQAVVLD